MSLMQVSIYAKNVFVGTLTRNAAGAFVSGVDPWVREDLFNYSGAQDGRHAQTAIPPARRHLFDGCAQQCADRRHRRSDHVPVARTGSGCLRQRGPAPGADLFANAARQGRDCRTGARMSACRAREKSLDCFVFQQSDGQFACVSRRRPGSLADGHQRHGDAGQRRHDLDFRPAQASDPRRSFASTRASTGRHPSARRSPPPSMARSPSRATAAATAMW